MLEDHLKNFICRRLLNSYTSENMLMSHEPKCENYDITTFRTSNESYLLWENHFHKHPFSFFLFADFEHDHEIDNSSIGNKVNNIFKQNPVCKKF